MSYVYKWRDDEGVKLKEMSFDEMYNLAFKNETYYSFATVKGIKNIVLNYLGGK